MLGSAPGRGGGVDTGSLRFLFLNRPACWAAFAVKHKPATVAVTCDGVQRSFTGGNSSLNLHDPAFIEHVLI